MLEGLAPPTPPLAVAAAIELSDPPAALDGTLPPTELPPRLLGAPPPEAASSDDLPPQPSTNRDAPHA
jgi:hypothetical protein